MTLIVLSGIFVPSIEAPRVFIHDAVGVAQGLSSCRVAVTRDQAQEPATIQNAITNEQQGWHWSSASDWTFPARRMKGFEGLPMGPPRFTNV